MTHRRRGRDARAWPRALVVTVLLVGVLGTTVGAQSDRWVAVLSDLHLGAGRLPDGTWHPQEDFRWDDDLTAFLSAIDAGGGGRTDLVLNGDTFELTEDASGRCGADDQEDRGCTEDEALARLDRVLAGHEDAIAAVSAFARRGENRVVVVPGDHDAALLFPRVGARVIEALGGDAGRVELRPDGTWSSADGQVVAVHGHQLALRTSTLAGWPAPFETIDGTTHLTQSLDERVADAWLDAHEPVYPTIDNLADHGAAVGWIVSASGAGPSADETADLLRYVLFRLPWSQFRVDLDAGDTRAPGWDLDAVRADGATFLVDALPDDDRFKPTAIAALETGTLDALADALTDAEVAALCDHRAAIRRSRRRFERILTQIDPQGPVVAECPRDPETRGGAFDYFWRTRDQVALDALDRLAEGRAADARPIAVLVHGHTHLVDWRQRVLEMTAQGATVIVDGFSPVPDALAPVVVNPGAWSRTVTPRQLLQLQATHGLDDDALLRALQPEDLAPCYSYLEIPPYANTPGLPTIRYWRRGEGGWAIGPSCGHRATLER